MRIYRQYLNDELLTRNIVIEFKNNIKFWLGGTKNKNVPTGINEVFHWNIIEDAHEKAFVYYEHIGANTKHLCDHKSRYCFKPDVYYKLEIWSVKGKMVYTTYECLFRNNAGEA